MRLGILGGTFDPVHYGHLLLAESAREQCRLDQVWFLPAAIPPHKQGHELSAVEQRIEMLELAVAGNPAMIVSRLEADRGGVTYTVDTLAGPAGRRPEPRTVLSDGGRFAGRSAQLARARADLPVGDSGGGSPGRAGGRLFAAGRLGAGRAAGVDSASIRSKCRLIELSSHDIRERVGRGQSIRYRTPRRGRKIYRVAGALSPANGQSVAGMASGTC